MNKRLKILHLEDSLLDARYIQSFIENGEIDHDYFLAETENDFIHILETKNIDIILSDYNLPDYDGNKALKVAREKYSDIPFIFVSGVMGEDAAIDAMLNGAKDYVLKSKLERLVPAIKRAMHEHKLETERKQAVKYLKEKNKQIEAQNEKYILINKELAFQNQEKEKRAAELAIANKELLFQNDEKEKRAAELIIANKELAFQNEEKEKRAAELITEMKIQEATRIKQLELEIKNKELEQFAYIASHDLQEPLRTVSNYIQVFEEDYENLLDVKARRYLQSANDAIKRMSNLIRLLLDFSRLGQNSKLTHVCCKKIIDEVIADLDNLIKTSKTDIEVSEMPALNLYESELRELFQNLITNAIKFRKKDTTPKIQIRSEKTDGKWKFSVSDNGIGIAPAHFEQVFVIFKRLHAKEDGYEGNGIGLANCKKIVMLHQGEIWIDSTLDVGTTFHFTIPDLT